MAKKRDYVESFHTREGLTVSYTVWLDGQGAELLFEGGFEPKRSLSMSPADIGAFAAMFEGMKDAVMRQFILAERRDLEDSLRAEMRDLEADLLAKREAAE